jgi:hypothetical protein
MKTNIQFVRGLASAASIGALFDLLRRPGTASILEGARLEASR